MPTLALRDPAITQDIVDFVRRSGKSGRTRALEKLRRRFQATAWLEGVRLDTAPLAAWAVIKSRNPVRVESDDPAPSHKTASL